MSETVQNRFQPIKALFQHSAIYALSTSIQRLQGLLLLPFYTSFTYIPSRSEFGNYVLVYMFIAFMNFFYLYGMDSALLRYFFMGKHDRRTVFSTTFLFLVATSVTTTILIVLASPWIAEFILSNAALALYFKLAAIILLFDSLLNLPYLILRAEEKPIQFTAYRTFRFVLEFSLNLLFVIYLRKGVLGILYANILAAVINFVVMLPVVFRYLNIRFNWSLAQEMLRFGLPFIPNGIAYMTIELVDRLLVEKILGRDAVGLYSANYKFGTIILLLVVAFRNAWQPFFLKVANQPNARQLYSRVLTYFALGGGLIVGGGALFFPAILTTYYFNKFYLLGPHYWEGIPIIPIILLSYFFYGVYVILTPGFYIQKKSQYMVLFTGSAALVNIGANLILLPKLGIYGAAIATLLSYFTMAATIFLVTERIYPIPVEWKRVGIAVALMVALIGMSYWDAMHFWWRVGIFVATGIAAFYIVLLPEERQAARRLLQRRKSGAIP